MKKTHYILVITGLCAALSLPAAEPPPTTPETPAAPPATNEPVATPALAVQDTNAVPTTNSAAKPIESENTPAGLRMNFKNAPLNLVLDYLVDAAGFIIANRPDVSGSVSIESKGPVTKDEAVALLNTALRKNNYSVTRSGRILTIISLESS